MHWTDEEIFHLMPAKNISWCKRKYLKVLLLEKNDAGFDWSNQQKRDCRLVIAKIFANYFVQFYHFYYWGPSRLHNTDLTYLHLRFLTNSSVLEGGGSDNQMNQRAVTSWFQHLIVWIQLSEGSFTALMKINWLYFIINHLKIHI